jgi:uncharacterized protein (UPF0276 family)
MTGIAKTCDALAAIPSLGSGLGYRRELKDSIFASRDAIDLLEIITEQFIGDRRFLRELEEICRIFTVIPHGIGLSIGSERPDERYLAEIRQISDLTEAPYYSEHLAMTRGGGIDIGHLSPLWFTEPVLRIAVDNVRRVQDFLNKPLALENVTYPFDIPGNSMSQTEFFQRLVDATGCGVLLDVTNVYINSENHGFDPVEFVKAMPLDRVVQIHLAGPDLKDGMLIDGHSETVDEGSWRLLETLVSLVPVRASILEHDANFPDDFSVLLDQVSRAREITSGQRAGGEERQ